MISGIAFAQETDATKATTEDAPVPSEDVIEGWHMVRPTDTLSEITETFIDRPELWEWNWHLNPEVDNPHRIFPRERLKVHILKEIPDRTILVSRRTKDVRGRRAPFTDWTDVIDNDLLLPADGLRTFGDSSAELLFDDDTRLVLSEHSLIFLHGEKAREEIEIERDQIEMVTGQIDLERLSGSRGDDREVEIVLGDAVALARAGENGALRTRARALDIGGIQVMVYEGKNAVEAAGEIVEIEEGMGVAISAEGRAAEPEKLPDAPEALQPEFGSEWQVSNPFFRWEPVAGASSYLLEVCEDVRCGNLVQKVPNLRETEYRPTRRLPLGTFYWRVTAVAASGLDGFPGESIRFAVLADEVDRHPPQAAVRIAGPQIRVRGGLVVGPGAELQARVSDPDQGSVAWTPYLDGEKVAKEDWNGPWTPGDHTVSVVAFDGAGNSAQSEPTTFFYDDVPPRLQWGLEGEEAIGEGVGVGEDPKEATGGLPTESIPTLVWSSSGRSWRDLGDSGARAVRTKPRLLLRPKTGTTTARWAGELTEERGLWWSAEDNQEGPITLSWRPVAGGVEVEAVDGVGNTTRVFVGLHASDSLQEPPPEDSPLQEPSPEPGESTQEEPTSEDVGSRPNRGSSV